MPGDEVWLFDTPFRECGRYAEAGARGYGIFILSI